MLLMTVATIITKMNTLLPAIYTFSINDLPFIHINPNLHIALLTNVISVNRFLNFSQIGSIKDDK